VKNFTKDLNRKGVSFPLDTPLFRVLIKRNRDASDGLTHRGYQRFRNTNQAPTPEDVVV